MASVSSITLQIGGASSNDWFIVIGGAKYHFSNLSLHQGLLMPASLSFTLTRDPEEDVTDPVIKTCGDIIGSSVSLQVNTIGTKDSEPVAFEGFVASASGSRNFTEYYINVECRSWDALLDDNPTCRSYEDKTLENIVEDVISGYSNINAEVNPRFKDVIPYCVQYNETNLEFLQRLARRYGEWLFSTGTTLVFGTLPDGKAVKLNYPSDDIPNYSMSLRVHHVDFNHVASSYSVYNANKKEGLPEMEWEYNEMSQNAFSASQKIFTKPTLQNLHSGGYAKPKREDSRETVLNISTKTQARGEKADMQTFVGTTYNSMVKMGNILNIEDNYVRGIQLSDVTQTAILVIDITHHFDLDHAYSNYFSGIAAMCDYPPYANSDVYPAAPS